MKLISIRKWAWGCSLGLIGMIFLAGCANLQSVPKKDFSETSMAQINSEQSSKSFYGVNFKQADTVIWVEDFGVENVTPEAIDIRHGLAYAIDLKIMNYVTQSRLMRVLKQNGFDTVKSFIKTYSAKPAVFVGTPYRMLDDKMGSDLFVIARESKNRIFWPSD